jgi:GntR family transcriptional repressor for pyruvate dehydrogenase complex
MILIPPNADSDFARVGVYPGREPAGVCMLDRKKKLSDYVIEEIKGRILSGALKEGDRLPNQIDFARQLGISRLSLREALNTLSQMGVIEQRPKLGTTVKSANPGLWVEKPPAPMLSDAEATMELLDARITIETKVASLAAERIGSKELSALARDVSRMKSAMRQGDIEAYMRHDMSFHGTIAEASGNRYLLHAFITIRGLMETFMNEGFRQEPDSVASSFDFHEAIFEALKSRDARRAEAAVGEHIEHIRSRLRIHYAAEHQ